jgi:CheY-like chemotaxis protein
MRTILVVDDNAMVRDVLQHMLEAGGFAVRVAEDAAGAVQHYSREPVDAVLIDFDLCGPTGLDACRALRGIARRKDRTLHAWLMTGVSRPGLDACASRAGAHGVLTKPFRSAELLHLFEPVLPAPKDPHRSGEATGPALPS